MHRGHETRALVHGAGLHDVPLAFLPQPQAVGLDHTPGYPAHVPVTGA